MKEITTSVFILIINLFLIHTTYADWEQINSFPNTTILSRVSNGNNFFLGTQNGILKSTDNGNTWTSANSGLNNLYVNSLCCDNGTIYTGTNDGLYSSSNNGSEWKLVSQKVVPVGKVAVNGKNICASDGARRVFFSTDNGENWIKVIDRTDYPTTFCNIIVTNKNNFYCSFVNLGVYHSIDNGNTWRFTGYSNGGLGNTWLYSFAFSDSKVFVGTAQGVYVSSDSGYSFKSSGFANDGITIAIYGNTLFAGTSAGVYLSNDDGITWLNIGLSNIDIGSIFIHSNVIFADIYSPDHLVWRRPLSEVTSVSKTITSQPLRLGLKQNYPNPCNPVTTIEFSIPTSSFTTLKIYDMLGRELSTIIRENLNTGEYSKEWNAGNYSSGIYFYTLQSGALKETKKLILQK